MNRMRNQLLEAGVRNLKEFGYPSVTTANILTDSVFRPFFASMLRDNLGKRSDADAEIQKLLAEIEAKP